jgi:hypothetical protein
MPLPSGKLSAGYVSRRDCHHWIDTNTRARSPSRGCWHISLEATRSAAHGTC